MTEQEAYNIATKDLTALSVRLSAALNVQNVLIVGGAVRDAVLGRIMLRYNAPKDIDVLVPRPLQNLDSNPEILWHTKNSMGGIKMCVRNIGLVDVFQHYYMQDGVDVRNIIANHFDFNCNSLYFSGPDKTIEDSAMFLNFLETLTLRKNCGYCDVGAHALAVRALKFQQQFAQKFGLHVQIHSELVDEIISAKINRVDVENYVRAKINSLALQQHILQQFNRRFL